jgi:hypothetical protein
LSIETDKKLQEISMENSREEKHFEDDDLADAVNEIGLMLGDGNNLRNNFADNQDDDGSDKSLEIPGSIETDLAKDIDRYCVLLKVVCVALKFDLEIF